MRRMTVLALGLVFVTGASVALAAGPRGSRGNPYPIKTVVPLPEGEPWSLRVNSSIPNATRKVMAWNPYNRRPRRGHQFFIVNVTLAYAGDEPDSLFSPERFWAVGRSNISYSLPGDSCGSIPKQVNFGKKVSPGGRLTGNLCFSVWKADVQSLLLFYAKSVYRGMRVFFRVR
jgi:hypothetical protein